MGSESRTESGVRVGGQSPYSNPTVSRGLRANSLIPKARIGVRVPTLTPMGPMAQRRHAWSRGPTADAERAEGRCAPTQKHAEDTLPGREAHAGLCLGTHWLPES